MYHFVWIPKYRHKVFVEPQREAMKAIIQKIGYDYEIDIVELVIKGGQSLSDPHKRCIT